ncbi:hypothetical protein, partial [Pseudomonas tohonis]|uniref:hypothetical protein n=1 Tax=Pseudomonas tohonis TaxID=2725477 RepID=UPI001F21957A
MNEHDDMNCEPAIPTRCAGHNCGTETAQHSPECILEAAIIQGWSTEDTLAAAKAVFDARATPPAAQVQGEEPEVVAWLNTLTGDTTSHQVQVMDWDDEKEPVQALMTVAQYERIAAALELKLCTSDYAYDSSMYEVKRLVRELDVLLNGEEGAAEQASLCDLVGQVASVVRAKGSPLLSAPP